eukprot:TRINITY_DN27270_c0_g1_i2.p1 TRINITY_DN27270_c0_g1~~TRINITY_DN27270_c0_g1_i2.p1  ORF type:complete len:783 (+),score=209.32 TRINITY_DN27270_c0_g1_i2:62-2410(+)
MPQVQWKSAPPRQAAGVADLLPDATVADLRRVVAEWFALPRAAVRVGLRGGKELSDDAEPPHRVVVWVRPHAEAICAAAVAAGLAACAAAASQPEAAGAAEPAPAAAAASQGAAPAAAAAPRAATRSIAEAIAEVDPAWQLPQVRAALDIAGGDPGGAVDLLLKCGALPSLPPLTQLLAHVPAFEEIRNTIFSNPAMGRQLIEGALDMVRTSHPALFELICRSNAEFFDLLTHGVSAVVGRAAVDPPPDGGQVSSAPPGFTVKLHGVADRVVSAVTLTLPPTAADLNQAAVREFEKPRVVWKGKELPASPTSLLELGFSDGATVFVTGKRRPLSVRRLASSGGPDLTVPYKSSSTVGQLKDSVAALSGIPAWEQRLVHGGRLLADDRKLLPDAGIAAGALLHLAPPPSVAAAAEAAAGEPSEEPSCPTSLGLRGLANLGNTCYMNAGLQCLAATEPLREHFAELRGRTITSRHGMRGALAAEFRRVLTALTASTEGAARPSSHPVSPARFKAVVGQWNSTFVGSGQHDAHELLRFVLDGLHGDLQRVQGPRPYTELRDLDGEGDDEAARRWWAAHAAREDSVIQDIFAGQLLSAVECSVCHSRRLACDPVLDLSISIPDGGGAEGPSVMECLQRFAAPERLEGVEAVHCPRCGQKQPCVRRIRISRLPPVLVVHLKRFEQDGQRLLKLHSPVRVPLRAELGWACTEGARAVAPTSYELFALIHHHGSISGGHYTAHVRKKDSRWYLCNDSKVSVAEPPEGSSTTAYICFFAASRGGAGGPAG